MPRNSAISHGYGWIPDVPDHRDQLYAAPVVHLAKLPAIADLRPRFPPVYDQGQLGSCTAYFTKSYAYLTDSNLAADLWTTRLVAG